MESTRRKNASLAINAILRGLEFDQLTFRYDETARPDVGRTLPATISSSGLLAIQPRERTTSAA
jgi:hypothetical protein